MDALKARAYAAYFKTDGRDAAQPSEFDSGEVEHSGKQMSRSATATAFSRSIGSTMMGC